MQKIDPNEGFMKIPANGVEKAALEEAAKRKNMTLMDYCKYVVLNDYI